MTEHSPGGGALHEDLTTTTGRSRAPSANPFAHSANITVSVPETVEIRLVDASALSDYEIWSFLTSILSSAVIGFGVAYFQATTAFEKSQHLSITLVFLCLMLVCAIMAWHKRKRLSAKARRVRFRVGEPMTDDPS
jgi:type III secretory pathway component EscS